MLEREFQFYKQHQAEFVKSYAGKFIVIYNNELKGVYSTQLEALTESQKTLSLGSFLIQLVEPGDANYTQTFHSRASFV